MVENSIMLTIDGNRSESLPINGWLCIQFTQYKYEYACLIMAHVQYYTANDVQIVHMR